MYFCRYFVVITFLPVFLYTLYSFVLSIPFSSHNNILTNCTIHCTTPYLFTRQSWPWRTNHKRHCVFSHSALVLLLYHKLTNSCYRTSHPASRDNSFANEPFARNLPAAFWLSCAHYTILRTNRLVYIIKLKSGKLQSAQEKTNGKKGVIDQ